MYQFVQNISTFLQTLGFSDSSLWNLGGLVLVLVTASLFAFKAAAGLVLYVFERWVLVVNVRLWRELLGKITGGLIVFNGLYFAALIVPIFGGLKVFLTIIYIFVTVFFLITVIQAFTLNAIQAYLRSRGNVAEEAIKTTLNFATVVSTIVLWLLAALIFLLLINVDIQALVSGLGIASIVIAFAFQNVLKDIFAFFTVYIDRSFAVGDYVTFDKYEGTIKEIRLRTTRIKALLGNELIVPNDQLTSGVIQNYNRFQKRRVSFAFKLQVAPAETVAAVIADIKKVFGVNYFGPRVELSSVTLESLSDYGLQIKIIYRFAYVHGEANYRQYLANKEQVNLAIMQILERHDAHLIQLNCQTS